MLALARFYFARNNPGDIELCHHQCITVLRSEHANEEASLIMADLVRLFGTLTIKNPDGAKRRLTRSFASSTAITGTVPRTL